MFLEDGDWKSADEYCERVLDQDPENAQAYLAKLMAELQVREKDKLQYYSSPFDGRPIYQKIIRFADAELKSKLENDNIHIREKNEEDRKEAIYQGALDLLKNASTESAYENAARQFERIPEYKEADEKARFCRGRAEEHKRKDSIYQNALSKMNQNTDASYKEAIDEFQKIKGWRDSDHQIQLCKSKIEEIKMEKERQRAEQDRKHAEEERRRIEEERRTQAARIAAEKAARRRKTIITVFVILIVLVAGTYFAYTKILIPVIKYSEAQELMANGDYNQAIAVFEELHGYKDSSDQIEECRTAIKKVFSAKCETGKIVEFGYYEQDNNKKNKREAIEWIVLARKDNKALLISKNTLNCQPYNDIDTVVTWDNSSVRTYLNEIFLKGAFTGAEQRQIITSDVIADKNPKYGTDPGRDTRDKIFLLSINEVNNYLKTDSERECEPTAYAKEKGCNVNTVKKTCWWWLRSPGDASRCAAFVDHTGTVQEFGFDVDNVTGGIRPALWISLNS